MVIACGEVKFLRDFLCDTPVAQKVQTSAAIRGTVRFYKKNYVKDIKISK